MPAKAGIPGCEVPSVTPDPRFRGVTVEGSQLSVTNLAVRTEATNPARPVVDSGLLRTTMCRSSLPATIWRCPAMKYLCLVYYDERKLDALRKSGHYVVSNALQPVDTATTIRAGNGKLSTTDGPFAETKEQLGGFILIEARDLNDA